MGEPCLQARAGMPVEIEEGLPVRPAVLGVPKPTAIAQQQRPILGNIADFHAGDHTDPFCAFSRPDRRAAPGSGA